MGGRVGAVLAVLLLVAACGARGPDDGDETSRIRLDVTIAGEGPLLLDLAGDPPTVVPAPGGEAVPVADLEPARELVEHVRTLPQPQDCRLDPGRTALVRLTVLPPPEIAERADASVEEYGGACTPPSTAEVERLLELWHTTTGDDTWQPDLAG